VSAYNLLTKQPSRAVLFWAIIEDMKYFFNKKKLFLNKGFTLVELLIVIAIIGILSSVVIASTTASRSKAHDVRRIGDLKEIELALALYYDVNRVYPSSLSTIVTDEYLPSIPVDPDLTQTYEYQLNSGIYCLGAKFEGSMPTDITDADCSIPSSAQGVTNDSWFKVTP